MLSNDQVSFVYFFSFFNLLMQYLFVKGILKFENHGFGGR